MMDIWIILTLCIIVINSSLLGSFLVLNRMSMIGDALSHSVLPGIVIAYLITGNQSSFWVLAGAGVTGLITTYLIDTLSRKGGFNKDSSIGVIYTLMFSIGVILITSFARKSDIDVECVLFGDLDNISNTTHVAIGSLEVPQTILFLAVILVINLFFILKGIKGFSISIFDPQYAQSIGMSLSFWSYLLLGLSSMNTVFSFDAVGAIMVISLMVIPATFANLFSKQLKSFILVSITYGIVCSFAGYYFARLLDINTVASISFTMGAIFLIAFAAKKLSLKKKALSH